MDKKSVASQKNVNPVPSEQKRPSTQMSNLKDKFVNFWNERTEKLTMYAAALYKRKTAEIGPPELNARNLTPHIREHKIDIKYESFYDSIISIKIEGEIANLNLVLSGVDSLVSLDGKLFSSQRVIELQGAPFLKPGSSDMPRYSFEVSVNVRAANHHFSDFGVVLGLPSPMRLADVRAEYTQRAQAAPSLLQDATKSSDHQGDSRDAKVFLETEYDYILYTTASPLDGGNLPLRSELIARFLVASGYKVLYIPFGKVAEPIRIIEDKGKLFQVSREWFETHMNRVLREGTKKKTFICSAKVDTTSYRACSLSKLRGWKILYELRDDLEAMTKFGMAKYYHHEIDRLICELADVIIVVSEPLRQKLISWRVKKSKIHVIPNGVSEEEIDRAKNLTNNTFPRAKRAVYFGHLFAGRCDYDLIFAAAHAFRDYELRLYGPGLDLNKIKFPGNVKYMGQVTQEYFLTREADAEIGLLPFKNNGMTFALSPLKVAQYYSLGLKIVSSDIYQIRGAPLVFSDISKSYVGNFRDAVEHEIGQNDYNNVISYMLNHRWETIVKKMNGLLEV